MVNHSQNEEPFPKGNVSGQSRTHLGFSSGHRSAKNRCTLLPVSKKWVLLGQPPPLNRSPRSMPVLDTRESPLSDLEGTASTLQGDSNLNTLQRLTLPLHGRGNALLEMESQSLWFQMFRDVFKLLKKWSPDRDKEVGQGI